MIDKSTVYYGLAIRRYHNLIEEMKKAIWATYFRYSSTDENPQYEYCPPGSDSRCNWQRANASSQLNTFTHDYIVLPEDVLKAIKQIYNDLNRDVLLQRCFSGFTQNNNKSLHNVIWKIFPKTMHRCYNSRISCIYFRLYI